jgi:hypothetical protein
MIVSILNRSAGFFSQFFFTLNHYLYAKKNKLNFKIDTSNWLFKYKNGWTDYFEEVKINHELCDSNNIIYGGHCKVFQDYKISDYIEAIRDIYILNNSMIHAKKIIVDKFELKNYCGIFIRRGDKLISESMYIPATKYLEKLLEIKKDCKKIFIQTDDYTAYLDIKNYLSNNNLNIDVITLCDKDTHGMIILNFHKHNIINNKNLKYSEIFKDEKIRNFKTIESLNAGEILNHTMDMLIGIDILLESDACVLDYQSNVSRFIKLTHKNNAVYDVFDTQINLDKYVCPAYSF